MAAAILNCFKPLITTPSFLAGQRGAFAARIACASTLLGGEREQTGTTVAISSGSYLPFCLVNLALGCLTSLYQWCGSQWASTWTWGAKLRRERMKKKYSLELLRVFFLQII